MQTVEENVYWLEKVVADFVTNVGMEFNKLYNSRMCTVAELRDFKEEMRAFKEEEDAGDGGGFVRVRPASDHDGQTAKIRKERGSMN